MGGIRLHHPTLAGVMFVVELPKPYPDPYQCPTCGKLHERKSIHLRLDSGGNVIVSSTVFERLREVFLAGMEVAGEVANPPPLLVGAVDSPQTEIVEHLLNAQNEQRFNRPAVSKHDWRPEIKRFGKDQP